MLKLFFSEVVYLRAMIIIHDVVNSSDTLVVMVYLLVYFISNFCSSWNHAIYLVCCHFPIHWCKWFRKIWYLTHLVRRHIDEHLWPNKSDGLFSLPVKSKSKFIELRTFKCSAMICKRKKLTSHAGKKRKFCLRISLVHMN